MKCPLCYEKRLIKHVDHPNAPLLLGDLEIAYECRDCGWIGAEPEREEG